MELGLAEGRTNESVCEDARFVLPNAAETKIVVTMNARELRHFFSLRCCRRAQWEINRLAWTMRHLVVCSRSAAVRGHRSGLHDRAGCPEGKMTCGQPSDRGRGAGDGPARVRGRARVTLVTQEPATDDTSTGAHQAGTLRQWEHVFGGQAVMEGVMMRGRYSWGLAVRSPPVASPASRFP